MEKVCPSLSLQKMKKSVPPYEYTSGVGSLDVVEKPTLKGIWMLLRPGVDKDYIDASSKGFSNNSDMTEMNYMPQLWEVYLRDIKDIRSHDLTTRQSLFSFFIMSGIGFRSPMELMRHLS